MVFSPPVAVIASPICHASPPRSRTSRQLAGVTLLLSLAGPVSAQTPLAPTPLTLDMALRAAETRSASLQEQDAAIRALREMQISSGRLPDPVLRLSVDNLHTEGSKRFSLTDDFMTMRSVSLMQTFVAPEKRQARSNRYAREVDAADSVRSMQLAKLRTQTARAWFESHYQRQILTLLTSQRGEAALVAEAAEASYRGGRGGQADVFAARASVARIDDRLHEVRTELGNADVLLARWVGNTTTQPLGAPPRIDHTRLAEYGLTHQLDQHPDIAMMDAKERVTLAEVDVARKEKNADWSWSLMYSKRGSQFGDMVSVGVSIPLQWDQTNRQDRELAARLEEVNQVRAEREERRRERLADVHMLMASWRSNLTRLDDYDKTLIPLASDSVLAQEAAFRGGKASLSAVLEARRMQIDTRLERLRIEKQTAGLWAELEFLIPESSLIQLAPNDPTTVLSQEPKQ